jgi:beta-carotene 3-hydroxylase
MNLFHLFLALATLLAMEFAVTLFHKHVMHGIGWGWHKSHHEPRKQARWEKNDLYAVVFSIATVLLFVLGGMHAPLWWVALGISVYGLLYGILHDVLVHRRLPLAWQPKNRYIQHLKRAHHLHHAVKTRDGGVSYGFLYAPPLDVLRSQLRSSDKKT